MFCDACGARNRAGARFCKECGAPVWTEDGTGTTMELPPRAIPAALPIPEEVRRGLGSGYEVQRVLGFGGMGTVYLATERTLERPVAIKVLRRTSADEGRAIQRFLQEARLAARLRHPGIVAIHSVGASQDLYYFTMDYIEGETLASLVAREHPGGLPPARARAILKDIALAVAHAHDNDVIHRDLKPGNIMIDKSGRVLVLDFGLAKAQTAAAMTNSGIVVGTPQYISPEHLQGKPATALGDVYAIGLIHYFMLVGGDVVQGDSVPPVVLQHLSGSPATQAAADARLPPEDARLILSLVQRDPARRTPSLKEVLRALDTLGSATPPPHGEDARPAAAATVTPAPAGALELRQQLRARERDRVGPDESERADVLLAEADDWFRQGVWDAALRGYSRAMTQDNRRARAWLGQILCLLNLGELAEAEAWADRALEVFPRDASILAAKAVTVARRGRVQEALALSDESMKTGERQGFVWWARGDILAADDLEAASACFERARPLAAGNAALLLSIARTLLSVGEIRDARGLLIEARGIDERHPMVWYHLGVAHRELAEYREAQEAFDHAVALGPANPESQVALRELGAKSWLHRGLKRLQLRMNRGTS